MKRNDYNQNQIYDALKKNGICEGDSLFLHSNIGFFGILENAKTQNDYCKAFFDAIFSVIGLEGTLVVPTFTYSYCWGKIFDKENTPSTCGVFTEYVRKKQNSFRSTDANFSISSIGKNAEYFTKNSPENPFGNDSFWERFLSKNGKICNLNFDAGSTFFHFVERQLNVSYRYDKAFEGKSIIDGKIISGKFYHYVRDSSNPNVYPNFTKFDKRARELGLAKSENLGRGQIVCISVKDTMKLIKEEIKKTPNFLIEGNLN